MTMEDSEHPQPVRHQLSLLPLQYTKVIHLVRHGEGYHNVAGRINHDNYKSFEYEDAHLTSIGWLQAEKLREHVQAQGLQVDLVVVSPLTRALETAVAAFGTPLSADTCTNGTSFQINDAAHKSGADGSVSNTTVSDGAPLLMVAQSGVEGKVTAHAAVSSRGAPPFLAHELCREHIGVHPCDKRRSLGHLKANFPAVDFSLVQSEQDALWTVDVRESKESIRARGVEFLQWLAARPERSIAVVTHSSFLHFTLAEFGVGGSTALKGDLHKWYENCEMRSLVLTDMAAQAPPCANPLHFPGGDLVVPGAAAAATGFHNKAPGGDGSGAAGSTPAAAGHEQEAREADKKASAGSTGAVVL